MRRKRPILVTRSSSRVAWRRPPMSVPSGRMVRNFVTTTTERPAPKRGWRKKTGPAESSLHRERDHRHQRRDRDEQEKRAEAVHHRLQLPGQHPAGRRGIGGLRRRSLARSSRRNRPRVRSQNNVPYHPHPHATTYTTPPRIDRPAREAYATPRGSGLPIHDPGKASLHGSDHWVSYPSHRRGIKTLFTAKLNQI